MMARAQEFIDHGSSGGLGPIFALAYPLTPLQVLEDILKSLLYSDCQQYKALTFALPLSTSSGKP